jgi:anti-sigma regulatory factor (Ser/Thr protein kinase)
MEQSIEVPAVWESIERLTVFTDEIESSMPLSEAQSYLLRMVIEEIATNVIKYGYNDKTRGVIYLTCSCMDGVLRMVIRDQGHPFDPRDQPEPDLGSDVEARTIGGLGLFLVREFADHLSYYHDAASGWNELVVVKG